MMTDVDGTVNSAWVWPDKLVKMDTIRVKTQQLLDKLQNKYGVVAKSPRPSSATPDGTPVKDCEDAGGGGEGEGKIPVIHNWFLVDPSHKKLRLPRTMLFLGRDECDIIIQSGTVDKRHAVITFDLYLSRFKVKDLSTTNGTYVNESRIPEQEYVTLNHMDTIRLGYDSKVYHMEQGEPCTGDSPPSPSPPLSLQQSPPPAPIHVSGGDAVCAPTTTKPCALHPPGWGGRHKDSSSMAECQGCIAEQRIEHTCTHAHTHTTLSQHRHHPMCPSQDPDHQHQFVDVQRKNADTREEPGAEEDLETVSPEPDPSDADALPEQKARQARNTWPRKKVRQTRRAVAVDLFAADDDDDGGTGEETGGEILVENGSNYFVSVDDSAVLESGRGRVVVEYSLSRTGSVHRIPRNSKNPLPPELETVKKGTPLYGQPSWWGEDADTGDKEAMEKPPEARSPRPSSLVVHGEGCLPHPQDQQSKGAKPVYMEIPHQAATPERDKPQRDKTTPARSSTSSLSKDSLVLSPDSARGRSVEKDSDPGKGASGVSAAEALSFTVEFGDEKKPKLKSGASLSQFVPMKLRNSLSSHARSEKASSRGRDSDGSCKNSEERELSSPIAIVKQRRLEEQCGSSETPSKGKSTRRSSGQGTGVGSLKSSDFGPESTPVSTKSRKDGEKRTGEKEVDKKPPKPQEPRKSSSRAPAPAPPKGSSSSSSSSKTKQQPSAAAIAASVQAAQYSDPTAYLIDRMFAGAADSPRSTTSDPDRSESPTAPEHVMYREAREYDRASQRGSGTYRASGSGSGKPLQKQKSLSKSPASTPKSPVAPTTAAGTPRATSGKAAGSGSGSRTPDKPSRASKEKSAEPERPLAAAGPAAALPKAPSPLAAGGGGGGDQEDKVSEAGTYTIEVEEDGEEELMARQQIDEVFGVDVSSFNFERPVIDPARPLRGEEEEEEEEEVEEKTLHEDDEGESMEPGCHTPCDVEGENVFDEEEEEEGKEEDGQEGLMSRSMGEEEVSWVSQLNSLTMTSQTPASPREAGRKGLSAKGTENASKKPPQGLSRKRPGTGRKLPSIPTANDQSPVSSEHSSQLHNSPHSPAHSAGPTRLENGHDRSVDDSPSRSVKFSPVVSSSGAISGKSRVEGSPCGSDDSATNITSSGAIPKGSSVCSRGSIDTELLLRDTETVMAAMEARMGFRQDDKAEEDAESDSDLTSTVAMVNGDEDFVKPTKYHSPRDKLTGKISKDKDNSNIRIASSSRKSLSRSLSEQKPPQKTPRSGAGVSVVSDVFSRSESLDHSFPSDASDGGSSDRTETTFSRSGSRGKGTITMTKPNRAFALRRARADGTEATDTARSSRTSAASTATAASTRRSSSIHGTPRTSYSDRTGTEASLGAQIVNKARNNAVTSKARESSMTRQDRTQRESLRRSSASSSASSTVSSAKKERDIRTLKSQLKSGPANKDLAITGISSRSQSQPGSRSNSPKAAERMAWKRRKEYDPRKAVAEAKAKVKEPKPKPKPKVQSSHLYKQGMTRSASFTNSAELSGRVRHNTYNVDSISSVEDLSSAATSAADPYGETGFRRAFIPFHNPLRNDRLSLSADEDEAGTFPSSQEPSNRAKPPAHPVSLMLHKSAFTPPLSKLQTPSPDSPSPQASLLLRRRTLGATDFDEAGASTAASSQRTQADSYATQSSSPQSYDSLIVSSIYQLTLKLKTTMDKALIKLREQDRASITPSPIDDFLGHPAKSEIPAWKSANQELAGVLKNLRKMEHHLHLMERALFPDEDTDTDVSGMSTSEKHKYFQEIERIRSELAGFQPIDGPPSQDPGSPEMAELSKNIH